MTRIFFRIALALILLLGGAAAARLLRAENASAADSGDLWRVVHGLCAPINRVTGLPLPCLKYDRERGIAVVRAPGDALRIIVVPTRRSPGVEDPWLLQAESPNLWARAWGERGEVAASAGGKLAWNDFGMAVNSRFARTQDQLHIHVSCVDPRLRRALLAHPPRRAGWFALDLPPWRLQAKRIAPQDIDRNIFRMIAEELPGARAHMGDRGVAVIPWGEESGEHGFVVLSVGDGHAEEMLDHKCRVASS